MLHLTQLVCKALAKLGVVQQPSTAPIGTEVLVANERVVLKVLHAHDAKRGVNLTPFQGAHSSAPVLVMT